MSSGTIWSRSGSTEMGVIVREDRSFQAALCPHCGGKVWPAETLEAHVTRHELRDAAFRCVLKPLQEKMRHLFERPPGWKRGRPRKAAGASV